MIYYLVNLFGASFMKKLFIVGLLLICQIINNLYAQSVDSLKSTSEIKSTSEKKWYESISVKGYIQARYNRLFETNSKLKCEQCDKSWGENGGIFLRRVRIAFHGQISKSIYFYIQPDFAGSVSSTALNFAQIRDAYFDIGLDSKNEFKLRIGQSKVPFGFENVQSSQIRVPLDRDDALNSAVPNERDQGVFFYWTPETKRKLYSKIMKDGLKGSGDYGVFSFGLYNGQSGNRPELNNGLHIVSRIAYPIELGKNLIEFGIQGYTGKYFVNNDQLSSLTKIASDKTYDDSRGAVSFILYPKPFGIQAEYNIGRGPQYNALKDSIETKNLKGGYILLSYQLKKNHHIIMPYLRYQYYDGGKKNELDARHHEVSEGELGVEWQPSKYFELSANYTISNRKTQDFVSKNNFQSGRLLRLQAQVNF